MTGETQPWERVVGDEDSKEEREHKYSCFREGCKWTREIEFDCQAALKSHESQPLDMAVCFSSYIQFLEYGYEVGGEFFLTSLPFVSQND